MTIMLKSRSLLLKCSETVSLEFLTCLFSSS